MIPDGQQLPPIGTAIPAAPAPAAAPPPAATPTVAPAEAPAPAPFDQQAPAAAPSPVDEQATPAAPAPATAAAQAAAQPAEAPAAQEPTPASSIEKVKAAIEAIAESKGPSVKVFVAPLISGLNLPEDPALLDAMLIDLAVMLLDLRSDGAAAVQVAQVTAS